MNAIIYGESIFRCFLEMKYNYVDESDDEAEDKFKSTKKSWFSL